MVIKQDSYSIYSSKKLTTQQKLAMLATHNTNSAKRATNLLQDILTTDKIGREFLDLLRTVPDCEWKNNYIQYLQEKDPTYTGVLLLQL